jgi:histidine kinase
MMLAHNLSLFWRLMTSYLLVIIVSCTSMYIASEALSPVFLDWHMDRIGVMPRSPMGSMMDQLQSELELAHGRAMRQALLWGVLISGITAGAVGLFISSRIASPIRLMQRASRRVAAGQYRERLSTKAPGEVGELAQAFNEMAEALERTEARRVELLANVAHEFRTPLSSLHGYIEGLEDGFFEATPETLSACKRQITRLEQLVADLSLLSRVETGQEPIYPRPTSAAGLLEQAVAAFRPQFAQKGIKLVLEPTPPSLQVQADGQRTSQVLANLIANALRHTSSGGEVRLAVRALPKSEIEFRVTDTGEGVVETDLPHIFTRFYRGDKARTRQDDSGSGIGLTIAKHFVEAQGGRIGVESQPGRGSSFWFTLPRATEASRA